MNRLIKALIFGKNARVTIIDTTKAVKDAVKTHNLTPLTAAVYGRALTAGVYLSSNLKGKNSKFSMMFKGGGPAGNVVIAGEGDNTVRGFVSNPSINLPIKPNGKLDVGGAVGRNGLLWVVKDYGLKEPYRGGSQLVSGEIAEDFAHYLLKSEGVKSAVALGVKMDKDGVIASGGVIIEALPGIKEEELVMAEDIIDNLSEISSIMQNKTINEIFEYYFGHLDSKILSQEGINYNCNCSQKRMKNIVKGLGKDEVYDIIKEKGKLEITCQFCQKRYSYRKQEVDKLWEM